MGLLALGTPLEWPEAKKAADQVRKWGIEQLLATWRRAKGKERDALLWGDEIEYLVVCFDEQQKRVRLSLRQADILAALASNERLLEQGGGVPEVQQGDSRQDDVAPLFHPEFGRFMLEATPGKPWGIGLKDLLDVEPDMKRRRRIAIEHMHATEFPVTMTTFPRLGSAEDYTVPLYPRNGPKLRSQFVPDEIANPHIRFPTLAANIRMRRGRKVEINVPIFRDEQTPWPFLDPDVNYTLHKWPEDDDVRNGAVKKNHIYMDAMAFGMGSCCLQITFQAKNIEEGRKMYDQLAPLGPIMLALTAATPIYKGFLADTDVRWNQISKSVDDRTPEELGEKPLEKDRWRIPKSRYASNSTYISQDSRLRTEYLDPDLVVDEDIKQRLLDGGMDELLATHFAHLFIRDPIVIFSETLKHLDLDSADHFENLQSTNWQHMRFKPPPASSNDTTGWRVEFRPMEIQLTDFENAAFSIFIVLITRAILSFDLNFYIPIPRITENMETAHKRDAVLTEKFFFRKDPFPARQAKRYVSGDGSSNNSNMSGSSRTSGGAINNSTDSGVETGKGPSKSASELTSSRPVTPIPAGPVEDEYELMTIAEIVNGKASTKPNADDGLSGGGSNVAKDEEGSTTSFPGLIPLVESYLSSINVDVETRCELMQYLTLIRRRADGSLWTAARWMRHFVRRHPGYKKDSVVSSEITYDLVKAAEAMARVGEKKGGRDDGLGVEMLGKLRN